MEATEQPTPGPDPDDNEASGAGEQTAPVELDDDGTELDLGLIEFALDGVAVALERLDAGTYWTDEITGEAIPDERLVADPIARRA